ncbi:unnamed protein product [Cylicostephanus goldi]|uniref:Uncharacterized protein n=1 Tax=Cylicostephanus goldi TaxID=71465 RepID=A0A3P7R4S6_CYLGO|nr:unnamed protein product [Cylicostephanus goldi]
MGSPGRSAFSHSGARMEWAPAPCDMDDAKVKKLAAKYKKTPAQVDINERILHGMQNQTKLQKLKEMKANK